MKISKNSKGIGWEKENDTNINIDGGNIDLSSYAKKSQLPTKTSQLTNDSGFITEVPSEYITEEELNAKGYLTEHQDISGKADKSEIPTKTSQLANDSDFATNASVDEKIANVSTGGSVDLTSYAKKTDLPTKTSQLANDSGYLTEHQDISGKADKSYVNTELAKKSDKTHTHSYNDLSDKPAIPSIDGLSTKKELTDGLATKSDTGHTHNQYLTEHQDLSDYALKTELPSVPTKTSQLTNDSGFITSIPSEYITETELSAKGYLTQHQDISGKVDKINGKGLSTNDYTTEEKNKLNGIEENANNYSLPIASSTVLGGIKIGSGLSIDSNGVLSSNVPSLEGNALTFGNYTIKYNETNDTLDFIYNGVIDEPVVEEIVLNPTWTDNMNLSSSDGSATSTPGVMITDFITIESGYNYSITMFPPTDATGIRIYFYTSSQTYISRTEDVVTDTWVNNVAVDINSITPSNAVYMRFKSNSTDGVTASNANSYIIIKKITA